MKCHRPHESRFPAGVETAHPGIAGAGVGFGKPGTGPAVLAYWAGHTRSARARKLGRLVIERLATDLKKAFPEMKGFSPRNLKYMRAFAEAWPDEPFVQQVAAQILWFHNCVLLDKLRQQADRLWYAKAAVQYGWSRNVLVHQIETALHQVRG